MYTNYGNTLNYKQRSTCIESQNINKLTNDYESWTHIEMAHSFDHRLSSRVYLAHSAWESCRCTFYSNLVQYLGVVVTVEGCRLHTVSYAAERSINRAIDFFQAR